MKRKKKLTESTYARNREFKAYCRKRFIELRNNGIEPKKKAIVAYVLENATPEFDVSYDYAYKKLSLMKHHRCESAKRDLQKRKWRELWELVQKEMEGRNRLNISQALARVLNLRKAQRFYITVDYGCKLFRMNDIQPD